MRTGEYVQKYSLRKEGLSEKNRDAFQHDLMLEYKSIIEVMKMDPNVTFLKWEYSKERMLQKMDAINNKTIGNIPDYIFDNLIDFMYEIRDNEFPEIMEQEQRIYKMNDKELIQYIRNIQPTLKINLYSDYISQEEETKASEHSKNPFFVIAWAENKRRLKIRIQKEKENQDNLFFKQKQYWREEEETRKKFQQKHQSSFNDWYNAWFAIVGNNSIPTESYKVLELPASATEQEVIRKYRELALKHHPDVNGASEDFILVTEHKNKILNFIKNEN
jgi:DnaJ-domain-containing protein 1